MRKVFTYMALGILSILFSKELKSQQITLFSQYLNNQYLINPAATNISNQLEADLSIRTQKSQTIRNINSYYFSVYGALGFVNPRQKTSNGFRERERVDFSTVKYYNPKPIPVIGISTAKDNFDLVQRNTFHLTTGLHLPLNAQYTISAAASMGRVQLNVSDNYFVLEDSDVPFHQFINAFSRRNFLDLGMGLYLYSDKVQLGIGMVRVFAGNSTDVNHEESFRIKNQFNLSLGYKLQLNKDWSLTPQVLISQNGIYGSRTDYSIRINYRESLWSTISMRNKTILVFNLGVKVTPQLTIIYAYDHGAFNEGMQSLSANELALKISLTN
ncbi:PorP/SprF family type IX secretion system membrane protein [Roseivirga sp.]|uniref:PorP/SprF family type IX secretion system membrane protein n=1 Tax=Roseivirga sp. TaxID=1964215 RepID=UPI003B522033